MGAISEISEGGAGRPGGRPDRHPLDGHSESPRASRQVELEISLLGSEQSGTPHLGSADESKTKDEKDQDQPAGAVILLVVEDADMRLYLRGCLAHATTEISEILEAGSLSKAKLQMADYRIDVIIAERTVANGTGLELYLALQARDEFRDLPVILVVDEPIPDEVRRLGSATLRVLPRPFNASQLCETVRRTIKAGARTQQMRAR